MAEDNENEFERDFSEEANDEALLNDDTSDLAEERILETNDETSLNDDASDLAEERISETNDETLLNDSTSDLAEENTLETNDELYEKVAETAEKEIDPIAEANESLITMNSAPFDETLGIMSQTLASIDAKMDIENLQLQKLDQLSEIKEQLNRLENSGVRTATAEVAPDLDVPPITEEDIPKNNIGHNQQEISELLEKIKILENKIQNIENQSNSSNERFEKIENVVERFEDLESEILVEYEEEEKPSFLKNLFKKKEKSEPYKKEIILNEPEIQIEKVKTAVPKDTMNIIEEAEDSLENTTKETLINENYDEGLPKESEKSKSNNLKYGLGMLLLLGSVIAILFFFNKYQIIDLDFTKVTYSIFSLIDSILK